MTREQERQRAAQAEALDTAARARRLEQRLADGERLLEEGKATEAKVAFDDALQLEPRNARGLEGRRVAEERIQASTTRAARRKALADGKALFDAGQYEPALGPLTDACADPGSAEGAEACSLLAQARQVLEGLRQQKELRADIDRLAAHGEELMAAGRFPEAQVAFESVLRLDSGHARARERLAEAERRTGEALFARWLPNREPSLALFEPEAEVRRVPHHPAPGHRHGRPGHPEGRVPRRGPRGRRVPSAGNRPGTRRAAPSSPGPCPSSPASTRSR